MFAPFFPTKFDKTVTEAPFLSNINILLEPGSAALCQSSRLHSKIEGFPEFALSFVSVADANAGSSVCSRHL